MKKKLFICLLGVFSGLLLTGCAPNAARVNVETDNETLSKEMGVDSLIEIGGGLHYDENTHIVYFWNGCWGTNAGTAPSAYYAPNGLPYTYDPQTNTLKEIGE